MTRAEFLRFLDHAMAHFQDAYDRGDDGNIDGGIFSVKCVRDELTKCIRAHSEQKDKAA